MGDLANMTNVHGEVNGYRLLKWLRSHEKAERWCLENEAGPGDEILRPWHRGRADLLNELADDLERELAPPDYPGDDDDTVDLDDPALGGTRPPCPVCGGQVVRAPQDADDFCTRCSPRP